MTKLSLNQRTELLSLLLSCEARELGGLPKKTKDKVLRRVLEFYKPLSKQKEAEIWSARKLQGQDLRAFDLPEDKRVEDAGLYDESDGEVHGSA